MELYNVNDIMKFLEIIHPSLKNNKTKHCIELRALNRTKKQVISTTIWDSEKSLPYLKKYLCRISNLPACVYYSVFSFDKTNEHKNINVLNSYSTQILVADFDHIKKDEIDIYYKKFIDIGIHPILINSGNGYQFIILLEREIKNKDILRKFNNLLYTKGFPVDLCIQASSQIMRLPYTYNCKEFDKSNKQFNENPNKKITFIEEYSTERYTLNEVFNALNQLETIRNLKTTKTKNTSVSIVGNNDYIALLGEAEWDSFAMPIQNILYSCEQGYRNNALITIITYFRNKGYTLDRIKAITKIWASHTNPTLDVNFVSAETERLYNYKYSGIAKFYNYAMVERFGALEINFEFRNKNSIFISNKIFKNYENLKGSAIRTYLFLVYEAYFNRVGLTRDDIIKKLNVSLSTVNRNLKILSKFNLINTNVSYKKGNAQYEYFPINDIRNNNNGFTVIEHEKLSDMLFGKYNSLSNSEIKVLLYMYSRMNTTNRSWESQKSIAKKTGYKSITICIITSNLAKKNFINKQQISEFFADKNKAYIIKNYDKHLYQFILDYFKVKNNRWKTNCIYWVQSFLEKNIIHNSAIEA